MWCKRIGEIHTAPEKAVECVSLSLSEHYAPQAWELLRQTADQRVFTASLLTLFHSISPGLSPPPPLSPSFSLLFIKHCTSTLFSSLSVSSSLFLSLSLSLLSKENECQRVGQSFQRTVKLKTQMHCVPVFDGLSLSVCCCMTQLSLPEWNGMMMVLSPEHAPLSEQLCWKRECSISYQNAM